MPHLLCSNSASIEREPAGGHRHAHVQLVPQPLPEGREEGGGGRRDGGGGLGLAVTGKVGKLAEALGWLPHRCDHVVLVQQFR